MPIYLVIYQQKFFPNGFYAKEILRVIPTTWEKLEVEIRKHSDLLSNFSMNPVPQCDYWARHDESLLANATRGE